MFRKHSTLVMTALTAAVALALTGCGSAAVDATVAPVDDAAGLQWKVPDNLEGSLTLYSANPQGLTDNLVAAFTEATGVEVNVFAGTTGKITAKLDAEWDNPQADVVYLASWAPAAAYAADKRTLGYQPFGYDTVRGDWVGEKDNFIWRDGSALALVVNTNVAPGTPTDWADLTDPIYKDQVIMPDPRESGTARDLIAAMVIESGEEQTWKLFDALFANGLVVQGANGPALDDVTAGSHAVILGGVDYSAYSAIAKGEPLKVIMPSSGTTISPRPVFILGSTQNPDAAKALLDFFFSAEGQALSASANMIPAQSKIAVADGTRTYDEVTQLDFTWDKIEQSSKTVLEQFTARYLG